MSQAQEQAVAQDQADFPGQKDWRVKLILAPEANYLYRAPEPGILKPLADTQGVIFPYLPAINVVYSANYDETNPVHTNYGIYNYRNSKVDSVNLTCDFTAQDTAEANYLLAVIHFFRSVTKMFYGQDELPKRGTPPPLVYIYGLGEYQFNAHPMVIRSFTYNLPNNVDYVKTTSPRAAGTTQPSNFRPPSGNLPPNIQPGGTATGTQFPDPAIDEGTTYVPTKISLVINCIPIITRNAISNRFSLKDYATGKLLKGSSQPGGGIW